MSSPYPDRADAREASEDRTSPDATAAMPDGFVCLRDETDDGTIRFAVSGELDIATAPELDQALRGAQASAQLVTVDLRRLRFMDGRGLRVIVAAAERAGGNGSSFRIVRGPPHVHRLFMLTETNQRIEITPTG